MKQRHHAVAVTDEQKTKTQGATAK
jgi:hypothetical protein